MLARIRQAIELFYEQHWQRSEKTMELVVKEEIEELVRTKFQIYILKYPSVSFLLRQVMNDLLDQNEEQDKPEIGMF